MPGDGETQRSWSSEFNKGLRGKIGVCRRLLILPRSPFQFSRCRVRRSSHLHPRLGSHFIRGLSCGTGCGLAAQLGVLAHRQEGHCCLKGNRPSTGLDQIQKPWPPSTNSRYGEFAASAMSESRCAGLLSCVLLDEILETWLF